jgi:hypothetical protein
MELIELKEKVQLALEALQRNEEYLLIKGLNERTIAAHLARYLAEQFPDYDVDPEYNGNVDNIGGKKLLSGSPVYPDIVIHKRGRNSENLLIIEVKKTINSGKQQEADEQKIIGYVGEGCEFRYPFGLFLGIGTKKQTGRVRQDWFQGSV